MIKSWQLGKVIDNIFPNHNLNWEQIPGVVKSFNVNIGKINYTFFYFADYGIKNVGHFALRCLRIEKFIPFWGEEITGNTTPNEVNRAYKVKFDKQNFIGKVYKI